MSEEYKITRTESLPAGWYWKEWDDGSGCLIAPDSARYYSYDLAPYSAQGGIEYQKESGGPSCPYGVFWGSLEEFKEYGENQMKHTMSQELIDRLRKANKDYGEGRTQDFFRVCLDCEEAADTIQYLLDGADEVNQALREQIEENERLKAESARLTAERDAAVADIRFMLSHPDDGCDLCGNKRECKEEKCPAYTSGIGAIDQQSGKEYPDFKWTCMDFDYGTCDFLENTPCNGCDFKNHWQWRGAEGG